MNTGHAAQSYGTGVVAPSTAPWNPMPIWTPPATPPPPLVVDLAQLMKLQTAGQLQGNNLLTLLRERGARAFEEGDDELASALRTAWKLLAAREAGKP